MSAVPQDGSFWINPRTFWTDERIARWKSALFTEQSTEVLPYLMILSPRSYAYWGKVLFALQPLTVSPDNISMDVRFFWLRPYLRGPTINLTTCPSLPNNITSPIRNMKLFNHITEQTIRSGTKITLRTDNPQLRSLPSKDLLEMQWALHRLTALSGGVEAVFHCYSSDDDDFYLGEEGSWGDTDIVDMEEDWPEAPVSFGHRDV